ncbi:MAG: hypothetical protein Greene041662_307 [Candidatus Peregrinibacteria bacterium Greene0416_62]|nr:MAG: hypothetical protein Greene041662_307 [Candidatus Peregrinibacteria bacterium Greene0416_62]TSC98763.1 MAG: hypothetical protein Greene101449_832 [Candidatus Peregrinibacteria bacterium Greene1014_49]
MLRILRLIAGVILVLIGLFALVTPLTPGAFVGLIGLEMLGFGFLIPKKVRDLLKKCGLPMPKPPREYEAP